MNNRDEERGSPSHTPVTLRPTTAADVPPVMDWERAPDANPYVAAWPEARHHEAIRSPHELHLVVERAGRGVGFVLLAGIGSSAPSIEFRRIVVSEPGEGIGSAAVTAVLEAAFVDYAASEVWLDVAEDNERARRLYLRRGFEPSEGPATTASLGGRQVRLQVMSMSRERYLSEDPGG